MKSYLDENEMEKLVISLRMSQPEASEDDILTVIRWAEEVELGHHVFESVMLGDVAVNVIDGECVFGITPKGRKALQDDMLDTMHNAQTDIIQ